MYDAQHGIIFVMLIIHIFLSLSSLVLHGLLAANQQTSNRNYQRLARGTVLSLVAASLSGLLLNDGTLHSYMHIAGMLAMFLSIHAIIFAARIRAKHNSQA